MNLLIDVNLSLRWVDWLATHGWTSRHWSTIGDPRAADILIMQWARENDCVVFTHDLDFGNLLAVTAASGPSVIQVRCPDPSPEQIGALLLQVLREYAEPLAQGALVVVEPGRQRVRLLPLHKK